MLVPGYASEKLPERREGIDSVKRTLVCAQQCISQLLEPEVFFPIATFPARRNTVLFTDQRLFHGPTSCISPVSPMIPYWIRMLERSQRCLAQLWWSEGGLTAFVRPNAPLDSADRRHDLKAAAVALLCATEPSTTGEAASQASLCMRHCGQQALRAGYSLPARACPYLYRRPASAMWPGLPNRLVLAA